MVSGEAPAMYLGVAGMPLGKFPPERVGIHVCVLIKGNFYHSLALG